MSLAETKLINFIFYHLHNVIIINNNKYAITDQISKKNYFFPLNKSFGCKAIKY